MNKETFINYKNWRYAKISLFIITACFAYYFIDQPVAGRKGNTFAGVTFGVLATLGILYLTYFGIRKRSYKYGFGSLVGTLSAHVWLGLILLLLVPLHSGFNFNYNIHTLTFVVMVFVVLSGVFGAIAYRMMPQKLSSQRGQEKPQELLKELQDIDSDILSLSEKNQKLELFVKKVDLVTRSYLNGFKFLRRVPEIDEKRVSKLFSALPEESQAIAIAILKLIGQKRETLKKLTEEIKINTTLKIWLYIHVPFTVLLLILLFSHIFSVLYYWT